MLILKHKNGERKMHFNNGDTPYVLHNINESGNDGKILLNMVQ